MLMCPATLASRDSPTSDCNCVLEEMLNDLPTRLRFSRPCKFGVGVAVLPAAVVAVHLHQQGAVVVHHAEASIRPVIGIGVHVIDLLHGHKKAVRGVVPAQPDAEVEVSRIVLAVHDKVHPRQGRVSQNLLPVAHSPVLQVDGRQVGVGEFVYLVDPVAHVCACLIDQPGAPCNDECGKQMPAHGVVLLY